MKNFMKTNTVTYNLMSFSGFKAMFIFSLLLDGPKTYEDIKCALENNEYINETISIDAIRIYINSLKKIGCKIIRTTNKKVAYYSIGSHPFELKISDEQVTAVIRVIKAISKSIELSDFIALTSFIEKLAQYITNIELKEKLINISPLYNIKTELISDLMKYAKTNSEITIYYNSPTSGKKNIDIIADKLNIINGKLYLYGYNSEYDNYSGFLVSKIIKIVSVNLQNKKIHAPEYVIQYELQKNDNTVFEPIDNEKILSTEDDKILVEITSKNKFMITQRILSFTDKCKVVSPEFYKKEIISILKEMKEGYLEC